MLKSAVLAALVLSITASAGWASRLPAGTEMIIRLQDDIEPGKKDAQNFTALLTYPVFAEGREALPAGSRIEGEVRGDKKRVVLAPREIVLPDGRRVDFNAAVKDIDREKLKADEREGAIEQSGSKADTARDAAQIGLAGASVGGMTMGSAKGMGIGAAIGVAAVLIGKKIANRGDGGSVVPAGTQLTVSLSRPLDLPDVASTNGANISEPTPGSSDPDRPVLRRREQ